MKSAIREALQESNAPTPKKDLIWKDEKNANNGSIKYLVEDKSSSFQQIFNNQFFDNKKPGKEKKKPQRELTMVQENTTEETHTTAGNRSVKSAKSYQTNESGERAQRITIPPKLNIIKKV